jgi:hypothetical protein
MARGDTDILGLGNRREGGETNGNGNGWSISGKGFRIGTLLAALGLVGGGTAWVRAKEDAPDVRARVLVLETDRDYIRRELGDMKRAQGEMNTKLDQLLQNDARRAGREEAGRRR